MPFPLALQSALTHHAAMVDHRRLARDAENISRRYRTESGRGKRLVTTASEALAYAAARMPATFGAAAATLQSTLTRVNCRPQTLLDVGAGTGAASWAAAADLALRHVTCLENESSMRRIGQALMQSGSPVLQHAVWQPADIVTAPINGRSDLVMAAYVLNEMTAADRIAVARKLWHCTRQMLIIIEPGTPVGYANLMAVRQALLPDGAGVAAPCPHQRECPLMAGDWCHFTCRIARHKLHKQLKNGAAPFEDEKYSYLSFVHQQDLQPHPFARVLRHPQLLPKHVVLRLCTETGIKTVTVTKKDKALYKAARKAKAGDAIDTD